VYFGLLLVLKEVGVAESEKRVAAIFLLPVWALEPRRRSFLPCSGSYGCLMAGRRFLFRIVAGFKLKKSAKYDFLISFLGQSYRHAKSTYFSKIQNFSDFGQVWLAISRPL